MSLDGLEQLEEAALVEEQTLENGSFQDASLSQQHLFEVSLHSCGVYGHLAVTTHRTEAAEPVHGLRGKPSTETNARCSSPSCISYLFYGTSQHIPTELWFQIGRIHCNVSTHILLAHIRVILIKANLICNFTLQE